MNRKAEVVGTRSDAERSRGQAVVEFALIAPILLFVLLIAVDFGRIFFTHIQLTNAAREGVAAALADPTDTAAITARVAKEKNVQTQAGEGTVTVAVACATASTGATIACAAANSAVGIGAHVTVSVAESFGFFTPMIGNFFNNNITLRASATGTVLGATALVGGGGGPAPSAGGCAVAASFGFKASKSNGKNKGKVEFTDTSTGPISTWRWTFGDGGVSTARHPMHLYSLAATWNVTLVASSSACSSTVSQLVTSS